MLWSVDMLYLLLSYMLTFLLFSGSHLFQTVAEDLEESPALKQLTGKGISKKEKDEYREASRERFFHLHDNGTLEARAVMVDMEQKVY